MDSSAIATRIQIFFLSHCPPSPAPPSPARQALEDLHSKTMKAFVQKLWNSKPALETVKIADTRKIPEMFEGWSTDKILEVLKTKSNNLNRSLVQVGHRKKRYVDKLKAQIGDLKKAQKDTSSKKSTLDRLQAQTAAAQADHEAAMHKEGLVQDGVSQEELRIQDLESQEKDLKDKILQVDNHHRIVTTLEDYHKNGQLTPKLPLGEESGTDQEDLQEAVAALIPSVEALSSETEVTKLTMHRVLHFFHLNGVKGAKLGINNPRALFCKKIIKIMYANDLPEREPSPSPNTKRKLLLAEMMEEAEEAEAEKEAIRQAERRKSKVAKRKSILDSEEPPKKRHKSSAWKVAADYLPEDVLAKMKADLHADLQDDDAGSEDGIDDDDDGCSVATRVVVAEKAATDEEMEE